MSSGTTTASSLITTISSASGIHFSSFACAHCRKSHRKCDRSLPSCARCQKKGIACTYQSEQQTKQPKLHTTIPQSNQIIFHVNAPVSSTSPNLPQQQVQPQPASQNGVDKKRKRAPSPQLQSLPSIQLQPVPQENTATRYTDQQVFDYCSSIITCLCDCVDYRDMLPLSLERFEQLIKVQYQQQQQQTQPQKKAKYEASNVELASSFILQAYCLQRLCDGEKSHRFINLFVSKVHQIESTMEHIDQSEQDQLICSKLYFCLLEMGNGNFQTIFQLLHTIGLSLSNTTPRPIHSLYYKVYYMAKFRSQTDLSLSDRIEMFEILSKRKFDQQDFVFKTFDTPTSSSSSVLSSPQTISRDSWKVLAQLALDERNYLSADIFLQALRVFSQMMKRIENQLLTSVTSQVKGYPIPSHFQKLDLNKPSYSIHSAISKLESSLLLEEVRMQCLFLMKEKCQAKFLNPTEYAKVYDSLQKNCVECANFICIYSSYPGFEKVGPIAIFPIVLASDIHIKESQHTWNNLNSFASDYKALKTLADRYSVVQNSYNGLLELLSKLASTVDEQQQQSSSSSQQRM